MSLFGRLRWMVLSARHRRRWERASAHLDGMLDEGEAAAFAEARETDTATREYSEDIQFIAQGLASLPQAEPSRSFALTVEEIAAAEPPAAIRRPAPKSLRLATAGAAAAIAAFAAVTAYDVLDDREESILYLEMAPVLQTEREDAQTTTAMLADFEQSEQAEAALEEPPAPAVAAIEEAEEADEEAASAEVAADEPESPSGDAGAIDWNHREADQAAAEEEAAAAPAAQARFAAQRTESSAGEDEPAAQPAPAEAEDQAEDDALLAPAAIEEDEEPAPAAPAQLEAAPEEDGDGELLMERGTEPTLLAESISAEDSGWTTPAQIALAIIAALAAIAAIWIKIRQPRRPLA